MIPPAVPFLSSDTPPFSWQTPASGSAFSETTVRMAGFHETAAGYVSTHYERLLVHIVHVQSHQVLPAAQVQAALILIHEEDAVVAGVEGEAEGPRRPRVHQL